MKKQAVAIPTPWYLAPLYARGQFSPRLLAAWVLLLLTVGLEIRGSVRSIWPPAELIWANITFGAALFGLGTLQKIQLDSPPAADPAPEPVDKPATE